jgi:hypothetical protein
MKLTHMFYLCAALSCSVLNSSEWTGEKTSCPYKKNALELNAYTKEQITPILPLLEEWVEREFLNYPYLWSPPAGQTCDSNATLINEEQGHVLVVKKNDEVIGVAVAVPFDSSQLQGYFNAQVIDLAKEQGFDPSSILYMSYFLTAPEHREDEHLVSAMYNHFVDFAHSIGKKQICYFEDLGDPNSPLKPEYPVNVEPWGHMIKGVRSMNIQFNPVWSTLQPDRSVKEEAHPSEFFIIDL